MRSGESEWGSVMLMREGGYPQLGVSRQQYEMCRISGDWRTVSQLRVIAEDSGCDEERKEGDK